MRNPRKTILTKSVQARLDMLNHALYAETHSLDIYVELYPLDNTVLVLCCNSHQIVVVYTCATASQLYSVLDSLTDDARFYYTQKAWWEYPLFTDE